MKNLRFFLTCVFLPLALGVSAQRVDRVTEAVEANPEKTFRIYKYDLKENIAPPALYKTQKAFREADSLGVDFVLIHMNTYGGMVDAADSIRTRIMQSKIPVIVFIDNNALQPGRLSPLLLIAFTCGRAPILGQLPWLMQPARWYLISFSRTCAQ